MSAGIENHRRRSHRQGLRNHEPGCLGMPGCAPTLHFDGTNLGQILTFFSLEVGFELAKSAFTTHIARILQHRTDRFQPARLQLGEEHLGGARNSFPFDFIFEFP